VGLFLSTTTNKIDKKGRISVPSGFRTVLSKDDFAGVILFQSYTLPTIEGVSMSTMEIMNNRVDQNFAFFSNDHDEVATVLFGGAVPLAFDGDGRITLPQHFIDHAQLGDQASFVGMGNKFQIWNPELFQDRQNKSLQSVQSQGVTLPRKDT
jgi:MraZ protein